MSASVQPGSEVCLNFSLAFEDGTLVDSSGPGEPWCFRLGEGLLVEGLEKALMGMSAGDHRCVTLGAEEAFGPRDTEAIQYLPRGDFPTDMALEPGAVIGFALPSGEEVPGIVLEVEEDRVLVDLNHPLAGQTIIFDVEVVTVA